MTALKVAIIDALSGHMANDYFNIGLCSALSQKGCEPILYANKKMVAGSDINFTVIPIYSKDVYSRAKPMWWRTLLYIIGTLHSLISASYKKINIVHYHFFQTGFLELFNVVAAKIFFKKVVVALHDVSSLRKVGDVHGSVSAWMLRQINQIIVLSKIAEKEISQKVSISKIALIPHGNYIGLVPPLVDRNESRRLFALQESDFVCLFFGNINHHKGLDLMLEALAKEKIKGRVKLLIAGKPSKNDTTDYVRLASELGVMEYCHFKLNFISTEEMPFWYSAADLVVLPYRNIYQSGVLMMAMSYQKPVLVSDIEGMRGAMQDGANGVIFRSEDSDDLADKIRWSQNNKSKLFTMAEKSFNWVSQKNSWDIVAEKTLAVYRRLIF